MLAPNTQSAKILKHLEAGRTLTSIEALVLFSCERLASRISELRKAGHKISSSRARLHSGKRASVYSLHSDLAVINAWKRRSKAA